MLNVQAGASQYKHGFSSLPCLGSRNCIWGGSCHLSCPLVWLLHTQFPPSSNSLQACGSLFFLWICSTSWDSDALFLPVSLLSISSCVFRPQEDSMPANNQSLSASVLLSSSFPLLWFLVPQWRVRMVQYLRIPSSCNIWDSLAHSLSHGCFELLCQLWALPPHLPIANES